MAKKNLASLMNGIMGDPVPQDSIPETETVLEDKSVKNPKKSPGRPKKDDIQSASETRATFIVKSETLRKLKYISLVESRMIKDTLSDALDYYISKWESDHCPISLPNA